MRAIFVAVWVATSVTAAADEGRTWLRLSGRYRPTLPTDAAQIRHALFIEGAVPLGHIFELTLATEMASEPTGVVDGSAVTLLDVPLRAGARAMLTRGRLGFGGGPLVTLHVLAPTRCCRSR